MTKEKRPKIKRVGTRRKSVVFLWALLSISLSFAVYKHFTAIDTHTIREIERVEVQVIDTSPIESFVRSFAWVYYSWPEGTEQSTIRNEALRRYLTDDLHMLNTTFSRDMGTSSTVRNVQIWGVELLDDHNFRVLFSVERFVRSVVVEYVEEVVREEVLDEDGEIILIERVVEHEISTTTEDVVLSYYTVIVHVDANGGAVITHNPTISGGPGRSSHTPPIRTSDASMDSDTRDEIMWFLTEFFTLYPTASESMLAHFVRDGALDVIEVEYDFLELVNPIFVRRGDQVGVYVSVRYFDPRTRAQQLSQFELVLERFDDRWMIVDA